MKRFKSLLVIVGVTAVVLSSPFVGLGGLGLLGVVADVSPAENRQFGWMFLRMGLPWFIGGMLVAVLGLLVFPDKLAAKETQEKSQGRLQGDLTKT